MKERMGVKSVARQQKIINNAYTRGKSVENFVGSDRKYLERVRERSEETLDSREIRVYQDKVFIFDEELCITILQLPKPFGRRYSSRKGESDKWYRQDVAC